MKLELFDSITDEDLEVIQMKRWGWFRRIVRVITRPIRRVVTAIKKVVSLAYTLARGTGKFDAKVGLANFHWNYNKATGGASTDELNIFDISAYFCNLPKDKEKNRKLCKVEVKDALVPGAFNA